MPTQDHIAKTRLVIRGLLALLKKRARRENLAELIYLADNKYYLNTGKSITGVQYIRAKHGPVAEDDLITAQVDCLVEAGLVCKAPDPFKRDGVSHHYWVEEPSAVWQEVKAAVGMGPEQILLGIVMEYGRISAASELAALSKHTDAYKNARPSERIQFKQSERAIERQKAFRAHPQYHEFVADVKQGLADFEAGRWVSHEDLMAELFGDKSQARDG